MTEPDGDRHGEARPGRTSGRPAPEHRRWVHPSELPGTSETAPPARSRLAIPVTAGLAGALAAFGLTTLVLSGGAATPETTSASRPGTVTPTILVGGGHGDAEASPMPPAVLRITAWSGVHAEYGSGVVYQHDGLVVTTASLVDGTTALEVRLPDGRSSPAEVLGSDPVNDLALLRVETGDLHPIRFTPPAHADAGDRCLVLGADEDSGSVVSAGTIRDVESVARGARGWVVDAIEVDADAAGHLEGGALVDTSGALLGIVVGSEGTRAVAVPTAAARDAVEELLTDGRAHHAWLGVVGVDAVERRGALVERVAPGSPAATAGLRPGDVVVDVGGSAVEDVADLMRAVRHHEPGQRIPVVVERDDDTVELLAVLGTVPDGGAR